MSAASPAAKNLDLETLASLIESRAEEIMAANAEDLAAKILHFYTHRPQQRLTDTIDIQVLVSRFIKYIKR